MTTRFLRKIKDEWKWGDGLKAFTANCRDYYAGFIMTQYKRPVWQFTPCAQTQPTLKDNQDSCRWISPLPLHAKQSLHTASRHTHTCYNIKIKPTKHLLCSKHLLSSSEANKAIKEIAGTSFVCLLDKDRDIKVKYQIHIKSRYETKVQAKKGQRTW